MRHLDNLGLFVLKSKERRNLITCSGVYLKNRKTILQMKEPLPMQEELTFFHRGKVTLVVAHSNY